MLWVSEPAPLKGMTASASPAWVKLGHLRQSFPTRKLAIGVLARLMKVAEEAVNLILRCLVKG
jgi:hypothetical protein